MKLLLDEHLPHQFRQEIAGHDVYTVAFMGWAGIENGELLLRAESHAFDAVITNDGGVEHEQNLDDLSLSFFSTRRLILWKRCFRLCLNYSPPWKTFNLTGS